MFALLAASIFYLSILLVLAYNSRDGCRFERARRIGDAVAHCELDEMSDHESGEEARWYEPLRAVRFIRLP
jgi:hypothetical protein